MGVMSVIYNFWPFVIEGGCEGLEYSELRKKAKVQ